MSWHRLEVTVVLVVFVSCAAPSETKLYLATATGPQLASSPFNGGAPPFACSRSILVVEQNGPWWRFRADGWPDLKQYGPLVVLWVPAPASDLALAPFPVPTACEPVMAGPWNIEVLRGAFGNPWHHRDDVPEEFNALTAQLLSSQAADWTLPLAVTPQVSWLVR